MITIWPIESKRFPTPVLIPHKSFTEFVIQLNQIILPLIWFSFLRSTSSTNEEYVQEDKEDSV